MLIRLRISLMPCVTAAAKASTATARPAQRTCIPFSNVLRINKSVSRCFSTSPTNSSTSSGGSLDGIGVPSSAVRNLAIIAHVDHGKTTLVDAMLNQGYALSAGHGVSERLMDSNDLEKERGITILSKVTSIPYACPVRGLLKLNIIDTPGHADFGGEVERILGMVDGVVLLVDAAEGPLPQTKFVLTKALKLGLKPIVLINKVDRNDARPQEVLNEVFDLFSALDADESQLDFPILHACGREGWAVGDGWAVGQVGKDLKPLFSVISSHIPPPRGSIDAPMQMLVSLLDSDNFLGRIVVGRVHNGCVRVNMPVKVLSRDGQYKELGRLTKLFSFRGNVRVPIQGANVGDIIAVAGLVDAGVADTLTHPDCTTALAALPIDPPTMAVTISVNDSPLAGLDGSKLTSRMLMKEAERNVAITVKQSEARDAYEVGGRGELQMGVLIETMRREGFELSISRPRVLYKKENDVTLEPMEELVIDVDQEHSGIVVDRLSQRKAELVEMKPVGGQNRVRLVFTIPSRGLIGYQSEFRNSTRGTGVLTRLFKGYEKFKGPIDSRRNGSLISSASGTSVSYALESLQDRGVLFLAPGAKVYEGMIVGENSRDNDLEVNPMKSKQLTNIRAAGKDETIKLVPHRELILEDCIAYIADDELVEVTPKIVRLRKKKLDPTERKKLSRQAM